MARSSIPCEPFWAQCKIEQETPADPVRRASARMSSDRGVDVGWEAGSSRNLAEIDAVHSMAFLHLSVPAADFVSTKR